MDEEGVRREQANQTQVADAPLVQPAADGVGTALLEIIGDLLVALFD